MNPKHFLWSLEQRVATITLNRPERKNPLTFESYRELANTFWSLPRSAAARLNSSRLI